MREEYLVWSNEHRAWWRANRCGYTKVLANAGHYSRDEAIAICAHARDGFGAHEIPSEIPIKASDLYECQTLRRIALSRATEDGK